MRHCILYLLCWRRCSILHNLLLLNKRKHSAFCWLFFTCSKFSLTSSSSLHVMQKRDQCSLIFSCVARHRWMFGSASISIVFEKPSHHLLWEYIKTARKVRGSLALGRTRSKNFNSMYYAAPPARWKIRGIPEMRCCCYFDAIIQWVVCIHKQLNLTTSINWLSYADICTFAIFLFAQKINAYMHFYYSCYETHLLRDVTPKPSWRFSTRDSPTRMQAQSLLHFP